MRTQLILLLAFFAWQIQAQEFTVYFELDDFHLTDSAKKVMVKWTRTKPEIKELDIHCHCDSSGSIVYNQALSEHRAETVKTFLHKIGVKSSTAFNLNAHGKLKPKYDNGSSNRYKNRRCDAFIPSKKEIEPLFDHIPKKGEVLTLPNLEFVGNQAVPMSYSMEVLDQLLQTMRNYPHLEINLRGHVCCDHNMSLSIARARTVYDFLLVNEIQKSRISYQGFSNTLPLYPENSEINEQKNRRVEVEVTSADKKSQPISDEPSKAVMVELIEVYFELYEHRLSRGTSQYNFEILAYMIRESVGYEYVFYLKEKDGDTELNNRRRAYLFALLTQQYKCNPKKVKVVAKDEGTPLGEDSIFLEITKSRD